MSNTLVSSSWHPADRTNLAILLSVLVIHVSTVVLAYYFSAKTVLPTPPKKLLVQTINLQPHPIKDKAVSIPKPVEAVVSPLPVSEKVLPQIKEEPIKKEVSAVKEPLPVPKEIPKEVTPVEVKPSVVKPVTAKVEPKPASKPVIEPKSVLESKPAPKSTVKPTPKPAEKTVVKPVSKAPSKEVPKKEAPKPVKESPKPTVDKTPKGPTPAELARIAEEAKQREIVQAKQAALLAQAQESLSKIEQGRANLSSVKSVAPAAVAPQALKALQSEALFLDEKASLSAMELGYRDELKNRLQLLLKLPEQGTVKIKLTLQRTGQFKSLEILEAKSSSNRAYVEKTLPSLNFPGFGTSFGSESSHAFVIILNSSL